jgi:lipoprotein-anchoring transpeptidase ErfK/SrfK
MKSSANPKLNQTRILIAAIVLLTMRALAQQSASARPLRQVIVSIPDRKLAIVEESGVLRVFDVSVGAIVSPSPTGEFRVVNRIPRPTYYRPHVVIPPGADNPLGTRWIGLDRKGFGIHGTNVPSSIGHAASHGCIRLRNQDIEQLFEMLRPGDSVEIRAERDDETAELFGSKPANSTTVAQSASVMTAGGAQ